MIQNQLQYQIQYENYMRIASAIKVLEQVKPSAQIEIQLKALHDGLASLKRELEDYKEGNRR